MLQKLIATILLLQACVYTVSSLQCVTCSSLEDEKCGKTLGYSKDELKEKGYIKDCADIAIACKKIEHQYDADTRIVTRECYNDTSVEDWKPKAGCGEPKNKNYLTCYCYGDNCNSARTYLPHIAMLAIAVVLSLLP